MTFKKQENEQHYQEWNNLIYGLGERDTVFFAKYFLGLHLNSFQERALKSYDIYKQFIWVTSNQIGKTVALAIVHIKENFYKIRLSGNPRLVDKARYETLNISPISRQAQEAAKYVEDILTSNFTWEEESLTQKTNQLVVRRFVNKCRIGWFWEGRDITQGRIDFSNNASMFCLSTASDQGSGLSGKQFALITYDECVQSHHLEEELGARIFSRTAKYSGPVGLIATPDELAKSQQYWYHLYTQAEKAQKNNTPFDWFLVKGLYDENIFITKEKKEEFKKRLLSLNPEKYKQVVLGEFLASSDRMFTPEMIEGFWNNKQGPTPAIEGHSYLVVSDWGVADSGDETVQLVADVTDLDNVEIVNHYSKQGGDPIELMGALTLFWMDYFEPDVTMDTAEMGGVIFRKMLSRLKPISFGKENKTDGLFFLQVRFRNNVRKNLTSEEKNAIGKIKCYYIPKLEAQLSNYKLDDTKIKQDWVMALSQVAWYIDKYKRVNKTKTYNLTNFYNKSNPPRI